ncbi:hypothetical protein [Geminicoccus flavidas]|uniref:hypothetical protein n=1 Tax=Geminicoccus flavidas TaxID=2506407 RepID=UPI00135CD293|nr:hypothetical protein [Geminicoccus flavidas]
MRQPHLFLVLPAMIPAPALLAGAARAADAAACYAISDADARTACLAKARRDPGMCYAVLQADRRAQCLAETRAG